MRATSGDACGSEGRKVCEVMWSASAVPICKPNFYSSHVSNRNGVQISEQKNLTIPVNALFNTSKFCIFTSTPKNFAAWFDEVTTPIVATYLFNSCGAHRDSYGSTILNTAIYLKIFYCFLLICFTFFAVS
jgi:hypothetical protein